MQTTWQANQNELHQYYQRLYPFEAVAWWLGVEDTDLRQREFSCSLKREDDVEIYRRYLSADSGEALRKIMLKNRPHKFDIGAVYNRNVAEVNDVLMATAGSTSVSSKPVANSSYAIAHDLIIDIDMNDYDTVRTCCQGKTICRACWCYLGVAAKILTNLLTNHFGFVKILYVFSGRRGLHIWVSDPRARLLKGEMRVALAHYMELLPPSSEIARSLGVDTTHTQNMLNTNPHTQTSVDTKMLLNATTAPSATREKEATGLTGSSLDFLAHAVIKESLAILHQEILGILENQNLFAKSQYAFDILCKTVAAFGSLEKLRDELAIANVHLSDSVQIWKHLMSRGGEYKQAMDIVLLVLLQPRLDVNVTKDKKHLLKAPFCIHQATQKVCCVIDKTELAEFDPDTVPTLGALVVAEPRATAAFNKSVGVFQNFLGPNPLEKSKAVMA